MPAANDAVSAGNALELRFQTASKLISRLYQMELTELRTRKQTDAFCQRHRIHHVQFYLNEKVLELARTTLDSETMFVISDVFLLFFILFSLNGIPYALGPFSPEHLTASGAEAVRKQYALTELSSEQILTYCGMYPSVSELRAQNIVTALVSAVRPEEPDKIVRRIASHPDAVSDLTETIEVRANHNTLIERRYAAERQMIEEVKQGDARAAIHQLHIMEQDVAYIKMKAPTIERERIGAAIFRTSVRHAAMETGLPALVIDQITARNAEEVAAARDEQTILLAKEHLVRSICKAIREAKDHQYSALVQNTLYYLDHRYMEEISIEDLSAEFGVSANYLIASFKKEVGVTPNVYLTKVRMKRAADLLVNGRMIIGDISVAVGIDDPNYFVKLFKKEFGETPSAFRKRHTI